MLYKISDSLGKLIVLFLGLILFYVALFITLKSYIQPSIFYISLISTVLIFVLMQIKTIKVNFVEIILSLLAFLFVVFLSCKIAPLYYIMIFPLMGKHINIAGYACSLLISYLLNTVYVFKQPIHPYRFIKFCMSYIPNFVIQLILVFLLFYYFSIPKLVVYGIAAIIGVPITFLMIKFYALKPKK